MLILLLGLLSGCATRDTTTVAAAASLREVMPEIVAAWDKTHPNAEIAVSYGASGSLRQQVEGGAPVDVVVFASGHPVDQLITDKLVDASTRTEVATNALVLVSTDPKASWTFQTLKDLPHDQKLAVGEPGAVPAGAYAKKALTALGEWDGLQDRVVFGGDVAAVLAYARRGEVAAAVVYSTDAVLYKDVRVLDRATGPWAPHPQVVGAVTTLGDHDDTAKPFLHFLLSDEGQRLLKARGFGPPG